MGIPLFAQTSRTRSGPPDVEPTLRPNLRPNLRMPSVVGRNAGTLGRTREVAALLLWLGALFLALALASYAGDPSRDAGAEAAASVTAPGPDWMGPVGAFFARGFVTLVGIMAWIFPVEMVLLGIPLVRGKPNEGVSSRLAGDLLLVIVASALVQVGWAEKTAFGTHSASGLVGELFGELARSLFSTLGSFLVGFASLGLILIGRAAFSFIALARVLADWGSRAWTRLAEAMRSILEAWRTAKQLERDTSVAARLANLPKIASPGNAAIIAVAPLDVDIIAEGEGVAEALADDASPRKRKPRKKRDAAALAIDVLGEEIPSVLLLPPAPDRAFAESATAEPIAMEPMSTPKKAPRTAEYKELTIVDTSAALAAETVRAVQLPLRVAKLPLTGRPFQFPSIDFLVPAVIDPTLAVDRDKLFENAELLVQTLAHYGVQGKVEEVLPGPTVTTYEVSPAAGTKVSKVAGLADDLALALARKVRIVAPIPGKNRIGFELPNDRRVPVNLRDLVDDRRFQTLDVPLPVVLGRDILGNPVYADLASMPHVIVAGATGAGKSVGLNVMLTSLLYRRSPEELRLLMIDPKVVELAPFDRIPHMLLPVVTDMKQAATALKWAVDEMERRYQLFADAGTKNIQTYNAWVGRVANGTAKNPNAKKVIAKDHNGLPEEVRPGDGEEGIAALPETLPFIVIVVDEFADLMMTQGKDVEAAVARLAQKARASGMHVILATQRPSVDVITGIIKANFPTRIAYRVSQRVDSRTILDEQGAEHLLGRGDMLIRLNGTNDTKRVQCPWVSEEEVQLVTDFLRTQGEPVYDDNILKPRDDEDSADAEEAEQDGMYDDAVRIVADTRRCSTSWLQRKLGLGYNRAARIVEMMERRGLVGPANGAKDREVLISAQ